MRDVAMCFGRLGLETCTRRHECDRFLRNPVERQVWLIPMAGYLGWLCPEFVARPPASGDASTPATGTDPIRAT